MIETVLQSDLITAMKIKDAFKVRVIKELKSKILVKQKDGSGKLVGDLEVVQIIRKTIKEHEDTLSYLTDGDKRNEELRFITELESYLPPQRSESEVAELIKNYVNSNQIQSIKEMGNVMKWISSTYPDIDKSVASAIVKSLLT